MPYLEKMNEKDKDEGEVQVDQMMEIKKLKK